MKNHDPEKMTYAESGVDIDAATEAKKRIRNLARTTFTPGVLTDIGSFGALFRFEQDRYREPFLVSSCDGVGTKLKVAFMAGIHNTVGYDLVSHCVSDILVQGARPLFFLDYMACGKLEPDVVEQVVSGLVRGCREMRCALIGGETAEMPDFYGQGEYDLAGFIVGIVDRARLVDGTRIRSGDRLLGIASAGLHTNGYSLARKLFFDRLRLGPGDIVPELGASVADLLLAPHRSYFSLLEPLLDTSVLKGMAHITGGGITENLPRILPPDTAAVISKGTWPVLPIFDFLQRKGGIEDAEMYRTFNMGIGMIMVVSPEDAPRVAHHLASRNEPCYEIGVITNGNRTVHYHRSA
jgi:phosphoribosylformylglycinamidine cyclo-ligase